MPNTKHEHKDNAIANCFILKTAYLYSTPQDTFTMRI